MSDLVRAKLGRIEKAIGTPGERCPVCGAGFHGSTVLYAATERDELRPLCVRCGAPRPMPSYNTKEYIGAPVGRMEGAP
jgi:hypothetical protein